ncbi:MAG: cytidine deaminase [Cyanobacteria bacterium SZAS LIN-2]|nr:cytidine deaminase [Cyanobacteria bacterium SZAS LIN-2]MBS2005956.1 cytidine deaminase [Cyanobacteria bacterium SZAS TMP-1]
MSKNKALGVYTSFSALGATAQGLVSAAWDASHRAFCFQSNFPVGSAILAENDRGEARVFHGCNVENDFFPATICAERNAGTTAVAEGYTRFKMVAVVCRKYPGGSPCGLCRQFLNQFGRAAVLLNIVDHDKNVRVATVGELLPSAPETAVETYDSLDANERRLVRRVLEMKGRSYVPYSKNPRGSLFIASSDAGKKRTFTGMASDNASYGGSIAPENVAMYSARTAGFTHNVRLITTVKDLHAANPIDGEVLQVLREFGVDSDVVLVDDNRSILRTALTSLLPDSFGPESL